MVPDVHGTWGPCFAGLLADGCAYIEGMRMRIVHVLQACYVYCACLRAC
jgi:hypothetical protein